MYPGPSVSLVGVRDVRATGDGGGGISPDGAVGGGGLDSWSVEEWPD